MRLTGRIAALTGTAVLISACGGSADPSQADSDAPGTNVENVAAVTTREVTQVVVTGADGESVDAIRSTLAEYELGPALERVIIVAASSCNDSGSDLVVCRAEPEQLGATVGRQVLIVLGNSAATTAETLEALGGMPTVVVSGRPDATAGALGGVDAPLTFVPSGLSTELTDPLVTFLIGVNDEFAAFTPVVLGDGHTASQVTRFFDSRFQETKSQATEAPQGSVPAPDIRWVLDLPDPLVASGSHERAVVVDNVVAFLGNDAVARGVDTDDGTVLWTREFDIDLAAGARSFVSASGHTLLLTSSSPGRVVELPPSAPDPAPDRPDLSLWALDIRTGDVIWEFAISAGGSIGHPATDGERVFVWVEEVDVDASFRALDIVDGTELWRTEGVTGLGPPRVDSGEVWVGSSDGALRGFDTATGTELARFDRIGLGVAGVASRPVTTANRVLFGNDNGTFYAIDRASGELVWSFATESPNLPSSPAIADDVVIFGSFDGGVYGLDIDSGELRWRHDREGDAYVSSAAVAGDTVYITSLSAPASLLALDTHTGEAVWELSIGEVSDVSPFVDGDTVYIQTAGKFWAVSR